MSKPSPLRHLLDPIGGDDILAPGRVPMLNLRRVELAAIAMILDAATEGVFGIFRQSPLLSALACIVIPLDCAFILAARRGQRRGAAPFPFMAEAFVVFALCASQASGYLIALGGRIPIGNTLVFLAAAAFFLIPPRRFALIGAADFLCFILWVASLDASAFDKIVAIFNTGLGIVAGIFACRGLHRMRQVEHRQRLQITAQNERLVDINRKLIETNTELNGLMAIAAHDLRSPLFGLRNLLALAVSRHVAGQVMQELLKEADRSIDAMLGLIGRMLEAHAAEDADTPPLRPHDLRTRLGELRDRTRPLAVRNGIELALCCPDHPVIAPIDPEMLDQILDNLASNAVRFSPPGSRIEFRAGLADGPFIEIADQGQGIPEDERAQLFTKFRRGSRPPLNGHRGSGLGLHIVRTLAQVMQAGVRYRPGEAGGSVFHLEFAGDPERRE